MSLPKRKARFPSIKSAEALVSVCATRKYSSPDGNLSTRDTEELITATSETQGKLAYAAKFLSYEATELQKTLH